MSALNLLFVLSVVFSLSFGQQNYRSHVYNQAPYPYQYGYNPQQRLNFRQVMPYPYGGYASPCQNPCASRSISQGAFRRVFNPEVSYVNYGRNYAVQSPSRSSSQYAAHPYANVPVEIIDVDELGQTITINRPNPSSYPVSDPYAKVPVQIIDVDIYGRPIASSSPNVASSQTKPVVQSSSQSDYTVSGGNFLSNSSFTDKPLTAVITRSFNPDEIPQPSYNLTFQNGNQVTEDTTIRQEETTEEATTTEIATEEPEDNEEPNETSGWFNRK